MGKRVKKPTIVQRIMAEVESRLKAVLHDSTRKQYLRHVKAFVRYCREMHDSRSLAAKKGMPVSYDKLALLATSIFKLSHWRNDVTVASYLLV